MTPRPNKPTAERLSIVTACFCVLILFTLPNRLVSAERQSLLQFNWQAGKRYTVALETSKKLVLENLPPGANKSGENEKSVFTISVLKAGPRENCELVVECLSTKSELNGESTYSFDSTTDPKKDVGIPIAALKRALIGTKIKYLLDSEYRVLHVDGTDELLSKMIAHDPALRGDTSTPFLTEAKFGTNALGDLLQEFMVLGLPKKTLKVGDQWSDATQHRTEQTVAESRFTFAGLERHLNRDCVRIEIDGKIENSAKVKVPSGTPIPSIHGRVKGNLWLDTKLEMLVERTIVEDTTTAMKMPVVHGEEGETVPMTMKQQKTVVCRLMKVEDN